MDIPAKQVRMEPMQSSKMPIAVVVIAILVAVVAIGVAVFFLVRHLRRQHVAKVLEQREDDQVHYAFIINPSKPQANERRRQIKSFCESKGIKQIEFINTQLDKDGRTCALEALGHGADVVVAVGGDGTVRTVASAMSGSGHAMGILPIGTGNLFARNLNIPVDDFEAALTIATSHGSRKVDVGRLSLLDDPNEDHPHAFMIIGGVGFDAQMIEETDPQLKKNISWLAYFVSGAKNLFTPKFKADVTVTDAHGNTHTVDGLVFRTFMAGNCGEIPVFSLMPSASYDDGLLDFEIIDTTGGLLGWANLFNDVVHQTITKKPQQSPLSTNSTIEQMQGVSAEIKLEESALAEVDGDMLGRTRHILITVDRQSLTVRAPESDPAKASAAAPASAAATASGTASVSTAAPVTVTVPASAPQSESGSAPKSPSVRASAPATAPATTPGSSNLNQSR